MKRQKNGLDSSFQLGDTVGLVDGRQGEILENFYDGYSDKVAVLVDKRLVMIEPGGLVQKDI